jgi:hypothetical protein
VENLLESVDGWDRLAVLDRAPLGPLVLAVEDNYGRGAAAVAGGMLPDGRAMVWGVAFPTRADAWAWAELGAGTRPGSTLLTGPGLADDPAGRALAVAFRVPMGAPQTRTGLALIRSLVTTARLAHDGGRDLAAQVGSAKVTASPSGGLALSGSGRADLVRATAWALGALVKAPETAAAPFTIR